tara:strand:+ start:5409 stop:5954 length:546 start_codon:yes stop_codon:yes gene_type:complete
MIKLKSLLFEARELIYQPQRLIDIALRHGFISKEEARERATLNVATEVAEETSADWPEGEGFGSSDFTYELKSFLDGLGYHTDFDGGTLVVVKGARITYTDGGRFYGLYLHTDPDMKSNYFKKLGGKEAKYFIQKNTYDYRTGGKQLELPIGYDIDQLDKIVKALADRGITAEHDDSFDPS